jgi:hypothetical protein
MAALTFFAAFGLAILHVLAARLRFLNSAPRSIWLSGAGGISVAYVFLHLLPELAEHQKVIRASADGLMGFIEHHAYVVAFVGLSIFYGLERAAKESRRSGGRSGDEDTPVVTIFWLHIGFFALYNFLIGYLLSNDGQTMRNFAFFSFAMAVHFLVNDFGLQGHYKRRYASTGRWLLAAAVLAGWAAGYSVAVPELAISVLVAFIAGAVVLNVLKEELPDDRQSRFGAFLLGGGMYAALLLAI